MIWDQPLNAIMNNKCITARYISERVVTIPINPNYTDLEVKQLINVIRMTIEEMGNRKLIK